MITCLQQLNPDPLNLGKMKGRQQMRRKHSEVTDPKEIQPDSITAKSDLGQNVPDENRRTIAEYLFKRNQPGDREAVRAMGFNF